MRFQQLTGPVMAKGVEDTAFYRQFQLASLNEVGGDPGIFGLEREAFHAKVIQRAARWPHNLLASSTHDTKRSEDVRARLNVLSEISGYWHAAIQRWSEQNDRLKTRIDGIPSPDPTAEYLLYQTMVGIWPLEGLIGRPNDVFVQRIQDYMQKALREAKVRSSWINPNMAYEDAVRNFIAAILRQGTNNKFFPDVEEFSLGISVPGLWNSLSQTVLKMTCPGVPDIFQGTELWDFSLVDPDNRRPVDYALRKKLLSELPLHPTVDRKAWLSEAVRSLPDGRLKLFTTTTIARFRRAREAFFRQAAYIPLEPAGEHRKHIVSFARRHGDSTVIVSAGRFFVALGGMTRLPAGPALWQDTSVRLQADLPEGPYRDVFSGETTIAVRDGMSTALPAESLFSLLPIAVLIREEQ
jgi:(1->4)-alpha-D-glucan 1-alpha-D-glucosylmutase